MNVAAGYIPDPLIAPSGKIWSAAGIARLAEKMVEAAKTELDTEKVIRCKGLGCESCLV